jgi:hypothetical protein
MSPEASAESTEIADAYVKRLVEALRDLPRDAEPAVTFDVMASPDEADQHDE